MSVESPTTDADLLDLLRGSEPMGVTELARATEVTATAVRQRLMRLMDQGLVEREAVRIGRGRPRHVYKLTEKGLRLAGSNFTDLALALWREITQIENQELRQQLLRRVAVAMAHEYADQIEGATPAERLHSIAELFRQWRIPASVEQLEAETVLTVHGCPYPHLADKDRSICAMERALLSELVGQGGNLAQYQLVDGKTCRFHLGQAGPQQPAQLPITPPTKQHNHHKE